MSAEVEEHERLLEMLKGHSAELAEHFESVMIFATRKTESATAQYSYGDGNWFARYGQVRSWVVAEERRMGRDEDDE